MHIKRSITALFALFTITISAAIAQSDSIKVNGSVMDAATSKPVGGAEISLPGISYAYTNDSGVFTITVPAGAKALHIKCKDYQQTELQLKGKTSIAVSLHSEPFQSVFDDINLPYVSKTASQTAFAVNQVTTNYKTSAISADGYLQGKVAGLNVINRSGSPGIGANMYLRGMSSIRGNNQPLILVDGLMYDNSDYGGSLLSGSVYNPLAQIDLKDIESISVIKDGNSLYGSKAGNGVILINTIHTPEAATRIDLYCHSGFRTTPNNIPMMDADAYRIYLADQLGTLLSASEVGTTLGVLDNKASLDYNRFHNNTNWQNQVFKSNYEQNYYMRVTGGDQIAKYALSVGYLNSKGIVKSTDYNRYNTRFNSNINMTSDIKVDASIAFTYGERNLFDDGNIVRSSPIYMGLVKAPIFAPYLIDSLGGTTPNIEGQDITGVFNPLGIIDQMLGEVQDYRFHGSTGLHYNIIAGFTFHSLFGVILDKQRETVFIPSFGVYRLYMGSKLDNYSKSNVERLFSFDNDSRLSYSNSLASDNKFDANMGVRYYYVQNETDWGITRSTAGDELKDLGSGDPLYRINGGYHGRWKDLSLYTNADYALQKKYILSVALSCDASTRFGVKADGIDMFSNRFGLFPSVGAAWLVSSEDFMNSLDMIDLLKARISYGITGNDDIGYYGDKKIYTFQRYLGMTGTVRQDVPNPYKQWETHKKLNIGFDAALLNQRVKIYGDWFKTNITGLMVPSVTSVLAGKLLYANAGEMENKGFEFGIDTRIINSEFKWDIGCAISKYENSITALPYDILDDYTIARVDNAIGSFYGFKTNGVYVSDADAQSAGLKKLLTTGETVSYRGGDVIIEDLNNDNIIDDNDKQIIGDPNPDYTGMASTSISWKRISLDALFTFSYGNDVYNMLRHNLESLNDFSNQTVAVQNRWKYNGQVTDIPRAEYGDPMGNASFSDRFIEDGSYFRLKTITLSYDLPIKNNYIQNAMVYVSGSNLLTFTNYLGYDPEFNINGSSMMQGIDFGNTPQVAAGFVGLKLGF